MNSPANYDNLLNTLQIAILYIDERDIITKVNSACESFFNKPQEELLGKKIISLFKNFDLRSINDFFKISGIKLLKRNLHIVSNKNIYVSFTATAINDEQGNYSSAVITCADISDSLDLIKQLSTAQSKLAKITDQFKEERDKFHMILESISDGVLVINKDLEIMHINASLKKLLGMDEEEYFGKSLINTVPEFFNSQLLRQKKIFRTEEITFINKENGVEMILHLYFAPVQKSKAPTSDMVFTVRDITRQKQMDAMKSQFVSNVSHELRTPLASIKGFASTLLRRPNLTEEQKKKFLNIIDSESDRLTRLIEDLLSLSRIEASSFTLRFSKFNLMELAQEIYSEIEHQLQNKNLTLEIESHNDVPDFIADRDKIFQVLLNLINNAIKFTHENTAIEIRFAFEPVTAMFTLAVTDHGPGISKENLQKVFDKFFRVENAVHTIPGTGLGLSIVQSITQKHGGTATVESELDSYTTFTLNIPQGILKFDTGIQEKLSKYFNKNKK